jgi:hypothetical protein
MDKELAFTAEEDDHNLTIYFYGKAILVYNVATVNLKTILHDVTKFLQGGGQ